MDDFPIDLPEPPTPEEEQVIYLADYRAAHRLLTELEIESLDGDYVLNLCERIRRLIALYEWGKR